MQDIYSFDVGDFGKLGLLRLLCHTDLALGVLWWRTQLGTPGADGKHMSYLRDPRFRVCDSALWDEMGRRFRSGPRTIAALEPLFSGETIFHSDFVPYGAARTQWLRSAMDRVKSVDVVFCDPDNGVMFDEVCTSTRHIGLAEVRELFDAGHSLFLYHHLNRSMSHDRQIVNGLERLCVELPGLSDAWGLHYRRGSGRVFFVLAQAAHVTALRRVVQQMHSSRWTLDGHFQIVSRSHPMQPPLDSGRVQTELLPRLPASLARGNQPLFQPTPRE
jgi:hypothetical protein